MKYITGLVNERNAIFGRPYLHDEYNADKDPNGWQADYWWGYGLGRSHWHIRPIPDPYGGAYQSEYEILSDFFSAWGGKHPNLPSFMPLFGAAWYDEDDADSAAFIPAFRFSCPKAAMQLVLRLKQISLKSMTTTDGKTKFAANTLRRAKTCLGPYVSPFKNVIEKMTFQVSEWDPPILRGGTWQTLSYKSSTTGDPQNLSFPFHVSLGRTTVCRAPGYVLLYGRKGGVPTGYVYISAAFTYGIDFWQGCGTTSANLYPISRRITLGRNYWSLDADTGQAATPSTDLLRWGKWTAYTAGDISFDVWEQDYYLGWTEKQQTYSNRYLDGMFGQLIFTLF
jgi:hypothetical protein